MDQIDREDPDQWWRASNGSGASMALHLREQVDDHFSVIAPIVIVSKLTY